MTDDERELRQEERLLGIEQNLAELNRNLANVTQRLNELVARSHNPPPHLLAQVEVQVRRIVQELQPGGALSRRPRLKKGEPKDG